ncbi:SURF1 family protein [Sulfuriflexus mobilis]|uniref:SURF1 family protein n=1 Tax=Sulfuriflexus mobilis TaxID=1811807 RepID=UPI000F815F0D|nr:SURF1 family protein [Sulfuriflexus mobilis]
MRIGTLDFSPKLLPTLATAILLPILVSLGFWQLDRAVEKQQLQLLMQERLQAPVKRIKSAGSLQEDMNFRRAMLRGHFDNDHQYLLDNRIYKGQVGYAVYTPFTFDRGESWIMVNRGWIASGKDRGRLPNITVSGEETELQGVLSQPPGQLMQLGNRVESNTAWPARVRNIDVGQILADTNKRLHAYVLNLDTGSEHAYFQDWKPYVDTPQKNQSYAIQWFSMAVVLLLIYISLNSRRVRTSTPKSDEE